MKRSRLPHVHLPGLGLKPQREGALFLGFLLGLLLWNLPFGGFVVYPFKLLATWLHEMSHGLVMLATGAGFEKLEIFSDTSGLAYPKRATGPMAAAAICSSGYMGTAVAGALIAVIGQSIRGARFILYGFSVIMAVSLIFWIDNPFGIAALAVGVVIFLLAARYLPQRVMLVGVNFLAAQACINAVLDLRVLFKRDMMVDGEIVGRSDAHTMAALSFGNHWLWAIVWMIFSFACFYLALRIIFRRSRKWREHGQESKS